MAEDLPISEMEVQLRLANERLEKENKKLKERCNYLMRRDCNIQKRLNTLWWKKSWWAGCYMSAVTVSALAMAAALLWR